ncbi:MAG: phosphate-starvation-inducible PsiE family protein [Arenicellales bacterium]
MNKNTVKHLLHFIEHVALVLILIATIVAIGQELMVMIDNKHVRLSDLLLLFIYLEVIAMIGIYYEEHRLPVRYPIYIAMVALARYIILDSKELSWQGLMGIGATILLLAIAVLIHRYGHVKFPYVSKEE